MKTSLGRFKQIHPVEDSVYTVCVGDTAYDRVQEAAQMLTDAFRERLKIEHVEHWTSLFENPQGRGTRSKETARLFVFSTLQKFQSAAGSQAGREFFNRIEHSVFLSDKLPVESIPTLATQLKALKKGSFHIASIEDDDHSKLRDMIRRMLSGAIRTDGDPVIADAWCDGNELVVLGSDFQRLRIPAECLKKYLANAKDSFKSFEIDVDGSYLYWPKSDVHLGWNQLRYLVDPAASLEAKRSQAGFNRRYGAAIRKLRTESGIAQSRITGLDERHVRRIENGDVAVTRKALEKLARAHKMDVGEYMTRIANRLEP